MIWRIEVLAFPVEDCTLDRNDRLEIPEGKLRVPKSLAMSEPYILLDGQVEAANSIEATALVGKLLSETTDQIDLEMHIDLYLIRKDRE